MCCAPFKVPASSSWAISRPARILRYVGFQRVKRRDFARNLDAFDNGGLIGRGGKIIR